jgi:hypothetical protein
MKSEAYSSHVSSELKGGLEPEARYRNVSLSSLLDEAAREWLKESAASILG